MRTQSAKMICLTIVSFFFLMVVGNALAADSTWDSIHKRKSLRIGVVQAPPWFLKDPAIVNGIFLEKPERIEILGLILLLSLLIWRLIEHSMRQHIKNTGNDLPGWEKKRTERPTTFMMVAKFSGVLIIKIGKKRILNKHLTQEQKEYLFAMGLSAKIFTVPRRI